MHKLVHRKKVISVFILLLVLAFSVKNCFALQITEIMYDPEGSDTNKEWFEIYNNDSSAMNLTGYKFFESGTNHGLTLINGSVVLEPDLYAVIAENATFFLTVYTDLNSTLFDSSFSLNNTGENISVKDAALNVLSQVVYNTSLGANGNNKTLSLINGTWYETIATPGRENVLSSDISNTTDSNLTNTTAITNNIAIEQYLDFAVTDKTYTGIFKLKNSYDGNYSDIIVYYNVSGNASLFYESNFTRNISSSGYANTGNITFNASGNYTLCGQVISYTYKNSSFSCFYDVGASANSSCSENLSDNLVCFDIFVYSRSELNCDYSIAILTGKDLFFAEPIKYRFNVTYGNDTCAELFLVNYLVYYLQGNNKHYEINTTTSSPSTNKTFTPDTAEFDRIYFIDAQVMTEANDTDLSNNNATKTILYFNNASSIPTGMSAKLIWAKGLYGNDDFFINNTIEDYYRMQTNDLFFVINGTTDDDYIDAYVKKSTRYNSNKIHYEVAENSYFEIYDFANLDYLCYSDDIDYKYYLIKPLADYLSFPKYFLFYDKNNELVNLSFYVKNDVSEIKYDFQLNKTEFCHLRYNQTTIDMINSINPLFTTSYANSLNVSIASSQSETCEADSSIKVFSASIDYYDDVLSETIPIKILVKSNRDYGLTFSFEAELDTKTSEDLKVEKLRDCDKDNDCRNVCKNVKSCNITIDKNQTKSLYFDLNADPLIDILKDDDKTRTQFTLNIYYRKDDQKTLHKLEVPMIIPYKYRKYAESEAIEQARAMAKSNATDTASDANDDSISDNSAPQDETKVEFKEASFALDDDFVTYSLGGISLLFVVSQLFKFIFV